MSDEVQIEPLPVTTGDGAAVEQEAQELRQYCIFRSGRERFCLSVLDVEEVVDWPGVTPVPLAPSFLLGIFNLRGSLVSVIDIAFTEGRRADLPPRRVVVARLSGDGSHEDLRLGIAADEVIGTHSTAEPLLVEEAPRDVPHCCGMLRHPAIPSARATGEPGGADERLAIALDLKKLIDAFPVPVI